MKKNRKSPEEISRPRAMGGYARAKILTAEKRREIAADAAIARWSKPRKPRKPRKRKSPDERARFERWLARYCFVPVAMIRETRLAASENGYSDHGYDFVWTAWQPRARRP